ncbi:sugar phosphate isomerase/epimerase family protein [Thermasporomyces composti]|uniref:Sugar phosphate isomerase/epimerase n=1 Tax=Thermasporomyces composti TaxID=696763 RepID=A0A3D9V8X9_THECX|nr:sugar phosphate isomerase/epimerase family protein [Thermasporomyces composti]REF37977.1 sugar phosphate isomerase/epimerase [Thermasporomyces composti]
MKFAVFTASLPEWTPEEAVSKLAEQGWDGIEWRVVDQPPAPGGVASFWQGNRCTWPLSTFEQDVPRIRELTGKAGLGMPSLGAYASSDQLEDVERLMRGAAALGVPQMRVTVGKPGPEGYRAAFERRRREYREVAKLARHYGVKALIELHHQSLISSASAAARFVEGLDPDCVGVIHDIGNMLHEGYEYDPWSLEILGEYLAHVHVKNAAPVPQRVEGANRTDWTWRWAPLRHGVANLPRLFEHLKKIGYDGWVSVEDFSTEVPLEERVRDNLAYLREIAG